MGWADYPYIDPGTVGGPRGSFSGEYRAPTHWAVTGDEESPETRVGRYEREQRQGEPGLEDMTLDLMMGADPLKGGAKALANVGTQAWRRHLMAREIPQAGEMFKQLGNPISNVWNKIKGAVPEFTGSMENAVPAMADAPVEAGWSNVSGRARDLMSELKGSWGVEIPYNAKGTDYPWAVIADKKIMPDVARGLKRNVSPESNGWYNYFYDDAKNYLGDVMGVVREALEKGTPIHETGHMVSSRARNYPGLTTRPTDKVDRLRAMIDSDEPAAVAGTLTDYFEGMAGANPEYVDALRRSNAYKNLPDARLGEELWTRMNAGQLDTPFWASFPEPQNIAPEFGERLSTAADDLLHPYFTKPEEVGKALKHLPLGSLGSLMGRYMHGEL